VTALETFYEIINFTFIHVPHEGWRVNDALVFDGNRENPKYLSMTKGLRWDMIFNYLTLIGVCK